MMAAGPIILMLVALATGCSRTDIATLDLEIVYYALGELTGRPVSATYVALASGLEGRRIGARVTATFRLDGNELVLAQIQEGEEPGPMSLVGTIAALSQDAQHAYIEFDETKEIGASAAPEISFQKGTVKIVEARFSIDPGKRLGYEGFGVKEVLSREPRMWK